jgi:hypothetical protein
MADGLAGNTMKLPNWQPLFHAAIMERLEMPFEWGKHDCILFAMHVLQAETGIAWRRQLADAGLRWGSAAEAAKIIGSNGGLKPIIERFLGEAVAWAKCGEGDLVLADMDGRDVLCVHDGAQLIGPGSSRITRVSMRGARCGWVI